VRIFKLDQYERLFNSHRPFVQGEVRRFLREFEGQRGDREVDDAFEVLQRTNELASFEVDNLKAQCDSSLPNLNANLLVAQSMASKILARGSSSEIEQALESSKTAREKEWTNFQAEVQDKCAKIDEAYRKKEEDLTKQYKQLEDQLITKQKSASPQKQ